jgi:hypothetical protein
VELKPELKGPAGSFVAEWGSKEDDDWQAYYLVSADFGLDPILGASIQISLSMAKLAMTAAGIPPPISSLTAEHIADILLWAKGACEAALKGGPRGKLYVAGARAVTGEVKVTVSGALAIRITARVGSDYEISASLSLEGETKVLGEGSSELSRDGRFVTPAIKIEPFTAKANVQLKPFKVFTTTKEKRWTPWKDEITLWEGRKRKLLRPGN